MGKEKPLGIMDAIGLRQQRSKEDYLVCQKLRDAGLDPHAIMRKAFEDRHIQPTLNRKDADHG